MALFPFHNAARGRSLLVTGAFATFVLTGCGSFGNGSSDSTARAVASSATPAVTPSHTSVPMPSVDQLAIKAVNRVGPAVVLVTNVGKGLGSGVVMTASGYIVTNNHVVSGASKITVTLANGQTKKAHIVGTDPVDDLAVIQISARNMPKATFGDSAALQVGQTVLAIGNPLGITRTVTEGVVSALDQTVSEGQGGGSIPRAIQTSAPINPGNSGGALVTLAGQVVGIPTLTAIDPEFNAPAPGIGFAIPSNRVSFITKQIINAGHVAHSGRAALGIQAESITPQLAAQYNLPANQGVLVAGLTSASPAGKAGMKAGDIIVKAAGKHVASLGDLLDVLAMHNPGDTIQVTVTTPGDLHRTVSVRLSELSVPAGH